MNRSSIVGGTSAYVGFTGATGGYGADQKILNWTFSAISSQALPAPTGLLASAGTGSQSEQRRQEKRRVLRMEFKTFKNAMLRLPCQIVTTSRRLVYRLLGWNPWLGVFFRLVDRLRC